MEPEIELDALLSAARVSARGGAAPRHAPGERALSLRPWPPAAPSDATADSAAPEHAELRALVQVAQLVQTVADRPYDARFAARLHEQMLARAATRRRSGRALAPFTSAAPGKPAPARLRTGLHPAWRMWGAVAALLVALSLGATTALAAVTAAPGTPLFGVRRIEQQIHVASTADVAVRARLHLQYAREWLADLQREASTEQAGQVEQAAPDEASYRAVLSALLADDSAAQQAAAQLPAGAARTELDGELAAFHMAEVRALSAALPLLTWSLRLPTTQALGGLGVPVPRITSVALTPSDGGHWQVVLTGSGFDAGAVLLVNGAPDGVVVSVTATEVRADLPAADLHDKLRSLGIGNPDGTAAASTELPLVTTAPPHGPPATPPGGGNGAHPTPTTPGASPPRP